MSTTTRRKTARQPGPEPLGPDSLTWRDFGSYRFHLMLPQAFTLQVAHPVIDAGVSDHSVYRSDPWGRAKRSTAILWPVVYARPDVAIQKGIELREMHRAIKGVDRDGNKYHALDPEAYAWVHGTGFDATLRMLELFDRPPTAAERATIFREWRQLGLMLGIRESDLPGTEAEYWEYFENMINRRLEMGPVTRDLMSADFYLQLPKPPNARLLPDFAWKAFLRVITPVARFHLSGTLPDSFRRRFDIPWSRRDERLFRLYCAAVRTAFRLTPRPLHYIPLARRAIGDARKHPEAFRRPDRQTPAPAAARVAHR